MTAPQAAVRYSRHMAGSAGINAASETLPRWSPPDPASVGDVVPGSEEGAS